jgi:hypothetical protein
MAVLDRLVFPIGAGLCKRSYGTSVAEIIFQKWHHEVGNPAILPPHPSNVQIPPSWLGDPNTHFRWHAITAKRQRRQPGSGESVTEYLTQWEDQDATNDEDAPTRPLPPEFDTWERATSLPGSPQAIKALEKKLQEENAAAAAAAAAAKQRRIDEADERSELRQGRGQGTGTNSRPASARPDTGTHLPSCNACVL